jgi:hypothetical protein
MAFVLASASRLPTLSPADAGFAAAWRQFPGLRRLGLGYMLSPADAGFAASSRHSQGCADLPVSTIPIADCRLLYP